MNYILFDDSAWENLLSLTFTKPVAALRVGILTIKEKWEKYLNTTISFQTKDYLSVKYSMVTGGENCFINGCVLPNAELNQKIQSLKAEQALFYNDRLIAVKTKNTKIDFENAGFQEKTEIGSKISMINYPWDIFRLNGDAIKADFDLITRGRKSQELNPTNNILGKENIFVEEGVKADFVTLNATGGPIYLGKDSEIMEGSVVRGPFALCEHSALKLSAKVYGPTTIGPHSKVGGEVNNSVIQGYSNKAHDGFLGNSVIGEWCNIGADSNNSNLKNNYAIVKVWNYPQKRFINTGLQFCGLIMGDHSKCGINTMFNTGTVVGVSANIFGSGFPRNFVPSFSWGGAAGFTDFAFDKAMEVAKLVMERREIILDKTELDILRHIYDNTSENRQ